MDTFLSSLSMEEVLLICLIKDLVFCPERTENQIKDNFWGVFQTKAESSGWLWKEFGCPSQRRARSPEKLKMVGVLQEWGDADSLPSMNVVS